VFEDSNVLGLGKTKEAKLVGFSKNQNPLKENQNPSRYDYNSIITNLKFQHKPKHHLSKILL
jgi:hypothetical protein